MIEMSSLVLFAGDSKKTAAFYRGSECRCKTRITGTGRSTSRRK